MCFNWSQFGEVLLFLFGCFLSVFFFEELLFYVLLIGKVVVLGFCLLI